MISSNKIVGKVGLMAAAFVMLFGMAQTANAGLFMTVGATAITDNGAGDDNAALGVIVHSATQAGWTVNINVATGAPVIGSTTFPEIDLANVSISSAAAGTLSIWVWQDLNTGGIPVDLAFSIGGTTGAGHTVSGLYCAGGGGGSTPLPCEPAGSVFGPLGQVGGGAYAYDSSASFNPTSSPYFIGFRLDITHTTAGVSSFDAHLRQVPEPSSLAILGTALLGLGFVRRRRFAAK